MCSLDNFSGISRRPLATRFYGKMPFQTALPNHSTSATAADLLANAKEFIKDKLYFTCLSQAPPQSPNVHFFTIDGVLNYVNFFSDFGPSSLAHVLHFAQILTEKFQNPFLTSKKICLYSSVENDRRANAAFLICSYMLIVHKQTPDEAYFPLLTMQPPFVPYRDAGYGAATYHITILDCLRGLHKALVVGLINLDDFNLDEYEFYEKVENGDLNWIGDKFIALASPHDDPPGFVSPYQGGARPTYTIGAGAAPLSTMFNNLMQGTAVRSLPNPAQKASPYRSVYQIDSLVRYLKDKGVGTIVRLNNKLYDRKKFVDAGVDHIEMYFPDGTTPPDGILKRFLDLCESRPGPIAVHCKAGLGRTGSLIAAFLMKHYRFTTSEVIGYLRIIRPGSVVGPQQNWLQIMQTRLWKMTPTHKLPTHISCLRPSTFAQSSRFPPLPFSTSYKPAVAGAINERSLTAEIAAMSALSVGKFQKEEDDGDGEDGMEGDDDEVFEDTRTEEESRNQYAFSPTRTTFGNPQQQRAQQSRALSDGRRADDADEEDNGDIEDEEEGDILSRHGAQSAMDDDDPAFVAHMHRVHHIPLQPRKGPKGGNDVSTLVPAALTSNANVPGNYWNPASDLLNAAKQTQLLQQQQQVQQVKNGSRKLAPPDPDVERINKKNEDLVKELEERRKKSGDIASMSISYVKESCSVDIVKR
ncbi:dual specificity protein phosphatase [Cladochytrium replicatum]|nr:dual specificity protein phosphatase [Cladochytrium replicatum]